MAENPLAAAKPAAAKPARTRTRGGGKKAATPAPEPESTEQDAPATEPEPTPEPASKKAEKKEGAYHVLEAVPVSELDDSFDGEVFVDLGVYNGVNADKAVDRYLDDNEEIEDGTFVPVPTRHFVKQSIGQEPQPPKRVRKRG